ncbi:NAD(P)/FAD-dependent oxidoreductase [Sphingomonas sp. G-3-2-10]|uniref:flavin monoamine oxidase family protein n=1 Tax=Sphingomonas sp. G-3-2-10 TaxID=2728838 RepID=UPI001469AF0B|nr:NAD(P)/FAD-dependent oxidoreductase [Sphingomonas sp. G-3-2-10]NML08197.1 NAD(P)-binding protein [Sphingomonas sp. G-3-2-10]
MRTSGSFWRAMQTARRHNLAAAGEAPPVRADYALTRRTLLQAIAAGAVVSALPREARAATAGKVAIIGGGIAGLTALHHLLEAGVDAQLYEARERMGGRMFTQRPAAGPAFEAGAQLVNTDHHDMQGLAKAFGVTLIDRKNGEHRTMILANGRVVPDAELAEALRGIAAQIGKDADRLDKSYARVAAEIDRMSIETYLDRHAALIPDPWVKSLLEGTSRTEYGVEPGQASALELIFNLPTVKGERAEVLGGSDERYVMEGGSSALIDAMTSKYARSIATGRRLLSVTRGGGRMKLAFLDGSEAVADTIIVAVPAPIMRQIDFRVPLPAIWRAFVAEAELGRNEKVQAFATATPWTKTLGAGGELWQTGDEGYALGWDGSVHLAGKLDPVWTWFLGGDQVSDAGAADALARRFARISEPAVPGLIPATAEGPYRRTAWHRDPLTLGAYSNYPPGFLTRFAHLLSVESDEGEHQISRAGNVFFAGEHLSDAFPGYMNGAAQTGRMAAEAITGKRLLAQAA